jgi:glycerol uptake facilitator-like aquaporin
MFFLYCRSYVYERRVYYDGRVYFLEFIGAFVAAGLVFGTYYDAINQFDHGMRQVKELFCFNKEIIVIDMNILIR